MKKKILNLLFVFIIGSLITVIAIMRTRQDVYDMSVVEALAEPEEIVTITCLPQKDAICISEIEDIIRIDHYFSPH